MPSREEPHVRLVSVREASERTSLKRTRLTELLDSGAIASIRLLDRRLVVVRAPIKTG
jgi:hypothetical protein